MILWSWIFFPRSKVWNGQAVVHCSMEAFHVEVACDLYYLCAMHARSVLFLHNLLCFTCAICADPCIIHAQSVHDPCIICVRSVHDLCIFCIPCACDVFHWSRVRTPAFPVRSLCRSSIRFLDPIACVGPVKSLAYITCPHGWSNRWHLKQKNPLEVKKVFA